MTTQQEVAEAFFNGENHPRSASNFRIVEVSEGGTEAYLVGGRNGADVVFAYREPLAQYEIYLDRPSVRTGRMRHAPLRAQQRRIQSVARTTFENDTYSDLSDGQPKEVGDVPAVQEELSDSRIPAPYL